MKTDHNEYKHIIETTSKIELPEFDADNAWHKVNEKIQSHGVKLFFSRRILKYASVIVLGIILGIAGNRFFIAKKSDMVVITATEGQKIDIMLPDGNKIWLNSGSKIMYPANFIGFNKQMELQGEAYFEISDENFIPLSIKIDNSIIQAFTGKFNIEHNSISKESEIIVSEGWVSLNNSSDDIQNIVIDQGQTCYISEELPYVLSKTDDPNFLAWKTGKLQFNDTPLFIVGKTLSEYYGKQIVVKGDIRFCRITSDYNHAELQTILNDFKRLFNTEISGNSNTIIITGSDC